LTNVIGFEKFLIPHVQGHNVGGYRLLHESDIDCSTDASGKPMAFGVNDAFPRAMFLHTDHKEDITSELLKDRRSIIPVDLMINSGKSILQFVEHIRNLHAIIHIVIVAGVVQSYFVCTSECLPIMQLTIVAFCVIDNKFTGKGTTDTGNRLSNTVDLS